MVRRTKRPGAHQSALVVKHSRDAVNARRLDRFFERHRRQHRRNTFREHRLARARRPDQQNVVASRAGNFQRSLRCHLSAHVAQIHRILARFRQHLLRVHHDRMKRFRRVHQIHGLRQRFHRENIHALHHRRFARVRFRHHQILDPAFPRRQRRRKRTAHRTHSAIERQLSQENVRIENFAEECSLATEYSKRHRQVERGAFLANVRGRQIYGDDRAEGKIESAIPHRGLDSFAAFFDGNVRQSDNAETALIARTDIHLDFDEVRIDAEYGRAECFEEHSKWLEGGPNHLSSRSA